MTEGEAALHRRGAADVRFTGERASHPTRAAVAALGFAAALAVLVVGPPLLPTPFAAYPLLTVGMVLDLLTPVVLIPAAWWLFRSASASPPTTSRTMIFVVLLAIMLEGQAMHLAANAIGEHLGEAGGALREVTHDLDETLSHFVWHAGLIGITVLLVTLPQATTDHRPPRTALGLTLVAAVMFGATFYLMVVEGGTGLMGVPAAVAIGATGLWLTRSRSWPGVPTVFVVGYVLATALFVVWAAMNGWTLPQFSEVGIL